MTQCPRCSAIAAATIRACRVCRTRRSVARRWFDNPVHTMFAATDRVIRRVLRYSGRASGAEFWSYLAFALGCGWAVRHFLGATLLDRIVATAILAPVVLAALSVTVRRLHDVGQGIVTMVAPPLLALATWHFEFAILPRLEKSIPHFPSTVLESILILAVVTTMARTAYFLTVASERATNRYGPPDPIR